MKVIFATGNRGKLEQVQHLVKVRGYDWNIISEDEVGFDVDVEETGTTFEENSKIKARALQEYCLKNNIEHDLIIADDAGLCVDILNGEPGIYSARWAGENKTNPEKLDFLLNKLKDYPDPKDRTAKFVSVITGVFPDGKVIQSRGELPGTIAPQYNVIVKLTYEPVFIQKGFEKPIGEMTEEEFSHVVNHRERAIQGLLKQL